MSSDKSSTPKTPRTVKRQKSKPAAKPAPANVKVELTRKQLEQAAKLRGEGATWNAIRETFGVKLGSSVWFRRWEAEGIEHVPAGERSKAKAS